MTDDTDANDGVDIYVNGAVIDATETAVEAAIQRGEAGHDTFPYFEEYSGADAAAERLATAAVPCLFPRPSYEGERRRATTTNPHAENRSRQRVIDNAVNNGGSL